MLRLLIALAYPVYLVPLYLAWSRRQAEDQIDKMQRAAFNTPGMEAPVPPPVLVGGAALIIGYWIVTMLFGIRGWMRALGMILGVPLGVAIYIQGQAGQDNADG
jgi:hypothetical protein